MILRYTILYVENVAAALDFYEKAFGLERLFLHESGDYGELATGRDKARVLIQSTDEPAREDTGHPRTEVTCVRTGVRDG